MIPLRILHLVPDPLDWTAQAAEPVLAALAQDGHESAWCCPLPHQPDPGGRTCIGYHPGWWRWWRNERTAAAARAAQWTPDLLHVHALSQLNVGIDLARTLGLAVVVSVHHSAEAHSARRLRDPLVAWVLVPTEHHRAHFLSRVGLPRDRLAILPSGVAVAAEPSSLATTSAWSVGHVVSGDYQATRRWLQAIADIQRSGLPLVARALTCDDGGETAVRSAAAEIGAEVGCQRHRLLRTFLESIDVLVLPSLHEVPDLLPVTAMALGRPVVGFAQGSLPELVRDGETGILLAPGDVQGLGQALRQLHARDRRHEFARISRALARSRYAAEPVAEATLAVYRAVLGGPDSSSKVEISSAWRRVTDTRRG
jgi:hypothetical protein